MENLIQRLENFIDIEYDTKNAEVDEILKLPIEERIARGEAMGGLKASFKLINLEGFGVSIPFFSEVTVYCEDNLSKFRETTPVRLHGHGHSFDCEVVEDKGKEMRLQISWGHGQLPATLDNTTGWSLDNSKVDIRHIVKKSLGLLRMNPARYQQLQDIFSGRELPAIDPLEDNRARALVMDAQLNDTQKEAFAKAYATKNYYLIQGPPGTGKTHLLAYIAKALAEKGQNVLITAFTHTAINNALQKVSSITKYPHVVKVGKSNQKENLNYGGSTAKNVVDFAKSGYNSASKGVIVGGTCYSVHTRKLEWMPFDVVIFDEAAQLNIPLAVAAMVKGSKFIFIGDHKQLPPIISDKQTDKDMARSVFELLYHHAPGIMLDVTYRMNEPINRFSSRQFYQGRLIPHVSCVSRLLPLSGRFSRYEEILDPGVPEVLVCHDHSGHTTRSEIEAEAAAEMTAQLLSAGVPANEIAIITPYRAQVRLIKNYLEQKVSIPKDLCIDTVERMQGQEREAIIFSMTTSDLRYAQEKADFLFHPNRFNVAITRAKTKRIVIAGRRLLEVRSSDQVVQQYLDMFRQFYEGAIRKELRMESVGTGLF